MSGAKRTLSLQSIDRLRRGRVVHGVAHAEITSNAQLSQERHQLSNGLVTQLPNSLGSAKAISANQLRQIQIGLLEQERGACGGAPSTEQRGLNYDARDNRRREIL